MRSSDAAWQGLAVAATAGATNQALRQMPCQKRPPVSCNTQQQVFRQATVQTTAAAAATQSEASKHGWAAGSKAVQMGCPQRTTGPRRLRQGRSSPSQPSSSKARLQLQSPLKARASSHCCWRTSAHWLAARSASKEAASARCGIASAIASLTNATLPRQWATGPDDHPAHRWEGPEARRPTRQKLLRSSSSSFWYLPSDHEPGHGLKPTTMAS